MRVLLAEDDVDLGRGLLAGLAKLGFTTEWVQDGVAAEHAASYVEGFDILVLDLGLPRQSGFSVLKALRDSRNPLPVLILTARDSVEDRINGLDMGADDYLVKPFDLHELAARIRAVVRRRGGWASSEIHHHNLVLDTRSKSVSVDGQPVKLSAHEYQILELLLNHVGQVVSKQQIESALYGWSEGVESNAVEVHIHHLRRKLGKTLIRTLRGLGYSIARD